MIRQVRILLLSIIIGSSIVSYSQIHFGGRVGINMNSLSTQPKLIEYDKISDQTTKVAPNVALLSYIEIGPYFAIQPELIYSRKGQKTDIQSRYNDTTLAGNWNTSYDYFEVPLMIKLSLNSEGFDPFVEFGAYYGYMFNAKHKGEAYFGDKKILDQSYGLDFGGDDNLSFNKNEYGFKLGIGGSLEMSKGLVFFSIRYSQGLTDIVKYKVEPANYQETKTRVFQLTVGYVFELRSNTRNKVYYY